MTFDQDHVRNSFTLASPPCALSCGARRPPPPHILAALRGTWYESTGARL